MPSRFSLAITETGWFMIEGLEAANDTFKTAPLSSVRIIKSDDRTEWLRDVKLKS
jgi:anaerobic glycerol-3-phosphate dehydrogenase